MKHFKPNLLTLALIAAGTSMSPQVFAAEEAAVDADFETEVIEVRGMRRSLLGSIDKKRYNDSISEVIDAGDLNSLPDVSIADALSRLPGVTAIRDSGQSSQLNIRGLNGDFIQTSLNGREQASTSGYTAGSRWIAFDQYPAELISQAAVYKSPKASLIEGGVAGTVELRTANPLEAANEHNVSGSVRLSFNDAASDVGADEMGHRLTLSYQGKFLDETLGLGLGVALLEQPNNSYQASSHAPKRAQDFDGDGVADRALNGFQIRASKGTDERVGLMGTLVYQPNDNLKVSADYFNSTFESNDQKNGFNFEGLDKDLNTLYTVENPVIDQGWLVGGTVKNIAATGPWFEIRSEDQSTDSTTESLGFKVEYITDDFEVKFDAAHSEGQKTRLDMIGSMHAYEFGTDTVDGESVNTWQEVSSQEITFQTRDGDYPMINLNTDYMDLAHMRLGDWEQFPHEYTDEIDSLKLDLKLNIDTTFVSSIEMGARWSEREFTDKRSTFRWGTREGQKGYSKADGSIVNEANCEFNHLNHPCKPVALDGFVTNASVNGTDYFELDLRGIADATFGAGNYDAQQTWEHNWTLIESGAVREEVLAGYVMANLEADLGDIPVTGNLGLRVVKTDTKSIGIQQLQGDDVVGDSITDDNGVTRTDYANVNYGPEYTDALPSVNLNFQLSENDQLRFAAAKVLGRPPVYQLRGGAGSWADTANDGVSPRYNVWSKGNPNLDPFRATQFDLSYEHFTENGGALTAAVFYKDIESLIETITYNEGDISWSEIGIEAPEGFVEGQYQTTRNTSSGGYMRGLELAYTTVFDQLPGIFSGLGINANYSYTESEVTVDGGPNFPDQKLTVPGLSKNVVSATMFWDIDNVSTHLNARYRDEFIHEGATPGGSAYQNADGYLTIDWQVTYAFDNGIDVVLQVNNLTDEPDTTNYGTALSTGSYQEFGRQFYLGANFKL